MKTVKVSKRGNKDPRRVEIFTARADGTPGYSILCCIDEFPHPRAGVTRTWVRSGDPEHGMQWWDDAG
jgi:hypothetical protein